MHVFAVCVYVCLYACCDVDWSAGHVCAHEHVCAFTCVCIHMFVLVFAAAGPVSVP